MRKLSSHPQLLTSADNVNSLNRDKETNLEICFNSDEIAFMNRKIIGRRKKFSSGFDRLLSIKIQEKGINCSLKCRSNYFSVQAKNASYWSGRYFCIREGCDLLYEASIDKWSCEKIVCSLHCDKRCVHSKQEIKQSQCRGFDGNVLALKATANGPGNVSISNKFDELSTNQG